MQTQTSVLKHLLNSHASLRPAEQRVAEYVELHPEVVSRSTISELAMRTDTSDATISRFCRQLGYSGFQEFKMKLAQSIASDANVEIFDQVEQTDPIWVIKQKIFSSQIQALQETLEIVSDSELARAVDCLATAERIGFYGIGGSSIIATDAYQKFYKLGKPVEVLVDSHMQHVAASLANAQYAGVLVSYSGSSRDLVRAAEIIRTAGGKTISITQSVNSPIAKHSDIVLLTTATETAFRSEAMSARSAQMAIMNILFTAVAMRDAETVLDNINTARRRVSELMF
ncbi:MurR/RpiR family transcriptional regulator [Alicyclobacillus curvatus]|jgi:RpiR family transcriptional regulator, carbohydrate utilization regulator|nr:MurR/RpiR family transcriptional regulator [Alicyclobacillus curvatus]